MHETFLVLGGGGMIGRQVIRQIADKLGPRLVIVASRFERETEGAVAHLRGEFPSAEFAGFWGDVFSRAEWNEGGARSVSRAELLREPENREALYEDLFGDFDAAYSRSQLARLVLEHRPDVVVDCINTATGISYQDVYTASGAARLRFGALKSALAPGAGGGGAGPASELAGEAGLAVENLLLSQSVPQLVRHVLIVNRAMTEAGTRLYLKVGTTGTGGMGLNVPYTHSEDKPSVQLMTKTAIAFAHTGLMFLMARTQGGPVVKEIKPGAMVGYARIDTQTVRRNGEPVHVFRSRPEALSGRLVVRADEGGYERVGELRMAVVDTGENGVFGKGEFEAITSLRQMEYMTPEEIAQQCVLEIRGSNTGYDVIAAIDSAVMNPTYRAGVLRQFALEEVARLERETDTHSVALGQLGPPELGKLLWEAHLLKLGYATLAAALAATPGEIAAEIASRLEWDENLRHTINAVGLPILSADGRTLLRGPFIRIPEAPHSDAVALDDDAIDRWADKGWVDLRPANFERWQRRFREMRRGASRIREDGSASVARDAYLPETIEPGAAVGWIFNNEEDFGYRIK
jgi:NAD(P)-dependent dehydrogenase (short-subunit alcohol dehydrogenase family)